MQEMEEWYCSLEGTQDKLPCLQMRLQSAGKDDRKAMKAEMLEAMRARKDQDLMVSAHDEMFERWCAEGQGPGVGSEPCDQWERRRSRRGDTGTRPPRSEAHEERMKMMEWYCSDESNKEGINCLHQELRRAAELTMERRMEVMEQIQATMSDHEVRLGPGGSRVLPLGPNLAPCVHTHLVLRLVGLYEGYECRDGGVVCKRPRAR
jgi:hypothetical protein